MLVSLPNHDDVSGTEGFGTVRKDDLQPSIKDESDVLFAAAICVGKSLGEFNDPDLAAVMDR
jgi:hypothetical protein